MANVKMMSHMKKQNITSHISRSIIEPLFNNSSTFLSEYIYIYWYKEID